MPAEIIDGKKIAAEIRSEIKKKIESFISSGVTPRLAIVQIGDDEGSATYSQSLIKSAQKLGIDTDYRRFESNASPAETIELMDALARDQSIHGIILQRPAPPPHSEMKLSLIIPPGKDVDCSNPLSMGYLALGKPKLPPGTPAAIVEILLKSGIETAGKRIAIVGRSNVVGKPLALMLSRKAEGGNATVTICHTRTRNLAAVLKEAEIVIAAAGSPRLINGNMLSPGAVVIDAGINWLEGKMVGDVDFDSAAEVAGKITPVPGGVGPVTGVMLFKNLVRAIELRDENDD